MSPTRFVGRPEPHAAFFWSSGADGLLRLQCCADCSRFHHPPQPVCPYCHSRSVAPAPVSGRATIATFTINHQPFVPGFDPPYAIALVEVEEDPTIRLGTNIVNCELDAIEIGMPVRVVFERNEDNWIPLFEPRPKPDDGGDEESR